MLRGAWPKIRKKWEAEGFFHLLIYLAATVTRLLNQLVRGGHPGSNPAEKFQIVLDYPTQLPLQKAEGTFNPNAMNLHWLIPDFDVGSGGHTVIFRIADALQNFGHKSTLWIYGQTRFSTGENAKRFINQRFLPFSGEVKLLDKTMAPICGDAVIATDRWSVYPTRTITQVRKRFYFVLDYEPAFFPLGSEHFLTENTYREGLYPIAAGNWLKNILEDRFQVRASSFDYGYEPTLYRRLPEIRRSPNTIAFYGRHHTPRRAVELGLLAFQELHRLGVPFHVDFFGAQLGQLRLPYSYQNHGVMSPSELAILYNQCQIGMVFSATNYSLIPNEMMACGLPVLELDGENTRSVFPESTIAFARPNPIDIAHQIRSLLSSPARLEEQSRRALEFVKDFTWERSARQVESALKEGLNSK